MDGADSRCVQEIAQRDPIRPTILTDVTVTSCCSADVGDRDDRDRRAARRAALLLLYHQEVLLQEAQEEGRQERFERL